MKQRNNFSSRITVLAFFSAILSCTTTAPTTGDSAAQQPVAAAARDYAQVLSWADRREALIAKGMTEAEADARIEKALAALAAVDRSAGDDRIGITPPPFEFDAWLNSGPLTLEDLKGRVVLVRWWTDTCPYCTSSAPALRALHAEYADSGLVVIGVFHPKAGMNDPLDIERVQLSVEARDYQFPVAIDWQWQTGTLSEWWLTGPDRPGTSVTFILDKSGVIRFVNPAMEYHDDNGSPQHAVCASDMDRIRATIEQLLAESIDR